MGVLYVVGLVVVFDTFHTPTSSMTPTLIPGDHGIINKLKMGGRIFDIYEAAAGNKVEVRRMPGYGRLERNDVIVFNATFKDDWNRMTMNMYRYYCKRAVAIAGDTLEICKGHYRVRGCDDTFGVPHEQRDLGMYMDGVRHRTPTDSLPGWLYAMPFDHTLGWTIADMGPLVVPGRDVTVALDSINYVIYRKYMEWETGQATEWRDGCAWAGARKMPEYTFTEDYCFAAGDHAINSQDSRYWGFVPEKFIVGVMVPGIRWNRKPDAR